MKNINIWKTWTFEKITIAHIAPSLDMKNMNFKKTVQQASVVKKWMTRASTVKKKWMTNNNNGDYKQREYIGHLLLPATIIWCPETVYHNSVSDNATIQCLRMMEDWYTKWNFHFWFKILYQANQKLSKNFISNSKFYIKRTKNWSLDVSITILIIPTSPPLAPPLQVGMWKW